MKNKFSLVFLALLISFRIHRFSWGCALEPCQNKPRLKHAWSPDVCPSAARPCPYVWQPVRQSTPKACPLFVLQNKTIANAEKKQCARSRTNPGCGPSLPGVCGRKSPSLDRLTHPLTISEKIMHIQKCPVTKPESRTVGSKSRLKKPKLGKQSNGSWVEVGFCRRSLSERSG